MRHDATIIVVHTTTIVNDFALLIIDSKVAAPWNCERIAGCTFKPVRRTGGLYYYTHRGEIGSRTGNLGHKKTAAARIQGLQVAWRNLREKYRGVSLIEKQIFWVFGA